MTFRIYSPALISTVSSSSASLQPHAAIDSPSTTRQLPVTTFTSSKNAAYLIRKSVIKRPPKNMLSRAVSNRSVYPSGDSDPLNQDFLPKHFAQLKKLDGEQLCDRDKTLCKQLELLKLIKQDNACSKNVLLLDRWLVTLARLDTSSGVTDPDHGATLCALDELTADPESTKVLARLLVKHPDDIITLPFGLLASTQIRHWVNIDAAIKQLKDVSEVRLKLRLGVLGMLYLQQHDLMHQRLPHLETHDHLLHGDAAKTWLAAQVNKIERDLLQPDHLLPMLKIVSHQRMSVFSSHRLVREQLEKVFSLANLHRAIEQTSIWINPNQRMALIEQFDRHLEDAKTIVDRKIAIACKFLLIKAELTSTVDPQIAGDALEQLDRLITAPAHLGPFCTQLLAHPELLGEAPRRLFARFNSDQRLDLFHQLETAARNPRSMELRVALLGAHCDQSAHYADTGSAAQTEFKARLKRQIDSLFRRLLLPASARQFLAVLLDQPNLFSDQLPTSLGLLESECKQGIKQALRSHHPAHACNANFLAALDA